MTKMTIGADYIEVSGSTEFERLMVKKFHKLRNSVYGRLRDAEAKRQLEKENLILTIAVANSRLKDLA